MFKSKKLIATLMIVAMLLTLIPMAAFAATAVSTPNVTVADSATGATTDYTITFRTTAALASTEFINVTFPASVTSITSATINGSSATVAGAPGTTITFTGVAVGANTDVVLAITGLAANPAAGAKKLAVSTTADATPVDSNPYYITAAAATRFTSSASIDKTEVTADTADYVKVTVNVADTAGNPVSGAVVTLATNRQVETVNNKNDVAIGATAVVNAAPPAVTPVYNVYDQTTVDGKAEFRVLAGLAGDTKIVVGQGLDAAGKLHLALYAAGIAKDYLSADVTEASAGVVMSGVQTVKFMAKAANNITLAGAAPVVADGLTEMSVVATVLAGSTPVNGATVTFGANKAGISFDKDTYTTDAFGRVTAKVTATKADTYEITARSGGLSTNGKYTFTASGTAYQMEVMKKPESAIAANATNAKVVKIKVTDINGNKIKTGTPITTEWKDYPSGASKSVVLNTTNVDANGYWQYDVNVSKEGNYRLRFKLANNRYVDVNFEAKNQGTITQLTLAYDDTSLAIPTATGATKSTSGATVKRIDANGVSLSVSLPDSTIVFSSSNPNLATVAANTGIVTTATNDEKDATTLTITAIDTINNLVATAELPLVSAPSTIKATAPAATTVGSAAVVTLQFVDKNGNPVAVNTAISDTEFTVLSKPEGAGVDVSYAATAKTDLQNTGKAVVNVTSNKAGDVLVQFRVSDGTSWYTAPATVKFGEVVTIDKGAKSLVLQIGSKVGFQDGAAIDTGDFAPFIKNSTTFVPVRVLANAFNAEAAWDGATNTATITRADIKITLVAGDKNVKVEKDGVSTTIEANEALFINENNRLCAPMRAIADAFGAALDFGPKDGAVEWVSFTQN